MWSLGQPSLKSQTSKWTVKNHNSIQLPLPSFSKATGPASWSAPAPPSPRSAASWTWGGRQAWSRGPGWTQWPHCLWPTTWTLWRCWRMRTSLWVRLRLWWELSPINVYSVICAVPWRAFMGFYSYMAKWLHILYCMRDISTAQWAMGWTIREKWSDLEMKFSTFMRCYFVWLFFWNQFWWLLLLEMATDMAPKLRNPAINERVVFRLQFTCP